MIRGGVANDEIGDHDYPRIGEGGENSGGRSTEEDGDEGLENGGIVGRTWLDND